MHFQAVTENFSPFDTILNPTTAEGLNESALALVFPLHTASPSNSSSRLHEISEDGEDAHVPTKRTESHSTNVVSEMPAVLSVNESEPSAHVDTPVIHVSDEKAPVLLKSNTVGSKIVVSEEVLTRENTPKSETTLTTPTLPPSHAANYDFLNRLGNPPRLSSQSARPSPSDLFDSSLYGFKPKVKLGPRPSLDAKKRPNTSGATGNVGNRSVSTLPAGLKMFPKKTIEQSRALKDSSRPKSIAEKPMNTETVLPPPPPIPDVPTFPTMSLRLTSRGSTKSMPSSISPEKKRLMKALELRRKQILATKSIRSEKANPDSEQAKPFIDAGAKQTEERNSDAESRTSGDGAKADSGIAIECAGKPQQDNEASTTHAEDRCDEESNKPVQSDLMSDDIAEVPSRDSNDRGGNSSDILDTQPETHSDRDLIAQQNLPDSEPRMVTSPTTQLEDRENPDENEKESVLIENLEEAGELPLDPESNESDLTAPNLRQKRRGVVEPIQIHVSDENSEADYLSDESFMDELQSAKVEEARSLSVSKSPATPIFSRLASSSSANSGTVRPSSYISSERTEQQKDQSSDSEAQTASQELSQPSTTVQKPQEVANVSRQRTVSSGISKRIQALAEQSHRTSPPATSHGAVNPEGSSSFLAFRKHSLRSQSRATAISPPKLQRGASVSGGSSSKTYEGHTTYQVHHKQGRPESISVTARIIRDPNIDSFESSLPNENCSRELYKSPLIINHHKAGISTTRSPSPNTRSEWPHPSSQKQNLNRSDGVSSHSSEQSSRDLPSSAAPRASESSTHNLAPTRASTDLKSPPSTARSQSNSSLASDDRLQDGSIDANTGKKKSRTSRLFKRMSNSMASANSHRRRSLAAIMSPTATETLAEEARSPVHAPAEPLVEEEMLESETRYAPVDVGDLNVQFPDTLLWKRRWVQIDAQGFLVLGSSRANEVSIPQPTTLVEANAMSSRRESQRNIIFRSSRDLLHPIKIGKSCPIVSS